MLSSIVDLLGVLVECLIFLIQLEIVITDLIFYIFSLFFCKQRTSSRVHNKRFQEILRFLKIPSLKTFHKIFISFDWFTIQTAVDENKISRWVKSSIKRIRCTSRTPSGVSSTAAKRLKLILFLNHQHCLHFCTIYFRLKIWRTSI